MTKPEIAGKEPAVVDLEPGTYWWCSCGKSTKQPFCDGAHKVERLFSPIKCEFDETKKVALCQCKQTSTPPYCDGTHASLK